MVVRTLLIGASPRRLALEQLFTLPNPTQSGAPFAALREDPSGGGDRVGKTDTDVPREVRSDRTFKQRTGLCPVAHEEAEDTRSEVRPTDGYLTVRRFGEEPSCLGLALARFMESAKLGEAQDQPVAIKERCR